MTPGADSGQQLIHLNLESVPPWICRWTRRPTGLGLSRGLVPNPGFTRSTQYPSLDPPLTQFPHWFCPGIVRPALDPPLDSTLRPGSVPGLNALLWTHPWTRRPALDRPLDSTLRPGSAPGVDALPWMTRRGSMRSAGGIRASPRTRCCCTWFP